MIVQRSSNCKGNSRLVVMTIAMLLMVSGIFYDSILMAYLDMNEDANNIITYSTFLKQQSSQQQTGTADYGDLLARLPPASTDSTDTIPKIIWRTGQHDLHKAPTQVRNALLKAAAMNPQYTQVYVDEAAAQAFMEQEFPLYARGYNALIPKAFKADLFRLCVLLKHGGVYSDLGHTYVVSLAEIIDKADQFVAATIDNAKQSHRHAISNTFLGATAASPILQALVEMIGEDISICRYGDDPSDITGSSALGHNFNIWKENGDTRRYKVDFSKYFNIDIAQGTSTVRGERVRMLVHNTGKRVIRAEKEVQSQLRLHRTDGKELIRIEINHHRNEELLQSKQSFRDAGTWTYSSASEHDAAWLQRKVYDKSKTDCSSTGIANRMHLEQPQTIASQFLGK